MNKTTFSKSLIKFDNSSALPTEKKRTINWFSFFVDRYVVF